MNIPKDPNEVSSIVERLRRVMDTNNPKGLPANKKNIDVTNPDFPLQHSMPPDRGWRGTKMITGSGDGPEIGATGTF